jgi:tetratricopeptide (TPR) repeat protein
MKILAAIPSGGNRESTILAAAACAESFVDGFVLIDTGESAQAAIALMLEKYGDRVVDVVSVDQDLATNPFSTSAVRNQCLREAERLGADWVCLVDTDHMYDLRGDDIREFLESTALKIVSFNSPPEGEWRRKPLFYRLPADYGEWIDDPHEWFRTNEPDSLLPNAIYWEQAKTAEERSALARSVVDQILAQPLNARNLWYLADAYDTLGQHDEAVRRFEQSARFCRGDFAASSWWRIAKIRECQGRHIEGIEACDRGREQCPRYPEFDWLASVFEYRAGNYASARDRAARALGLGAAQKAIPRASWSCSKAWREGPLDVLAFACAALGDLEGERAARLLSMQESGLGTG